MFTIALPFAIVLVCAFARQPVLSPELGPADPADKEPDQDLYRDILAPYEPYAQYDYGPKIYSLARPDILVPQVASDDLLSREINLLSRYEGLSPEARDPYGVLEDYQDQPSALLAKLLGLGADYRQFNSAQKLRLDDIEENIDNTLPVEEVIDPEPVKENPKEVEKTKEEIELETLENKEKRKNFALTPLDEGYFDVVDKPAPKPKVDNQLMEPRKTRQNPNWSRSKTLVADNLDELRMGVTDQDSGSTTRPHHIHIIETIKPKQAESIYGTALLAAIGAAVSMALVGLVFGWYTLSRKAKAAADVDYPAYGVTGPTVDPNGDRKLAHSAHMYHYQHQKQQILAMESRSCLGRNGSISDPESEEENEEGDYTVYECPGFATTGDMEVKNPLFNEDPTPATPGKCEVVAPQPKE